MAFECKNEDKSESNPPKNNSQPTKNNSQTTSTSRSLSGTGWKIDFGKGETGTVFNFYKNGAWEIVPQDYRTKGAVGKSYTVSGNTLTTVNADDGMVEEWEMRWDGEILVLFDGTTTLRLHYDGETDR